MASTGRISTPSASAHFTVGLYQVTAIVPDVPPGDAVPVQVEVVSPQVTMAIR